MDLSRILPTVVKLLVIVEILRIYTRLYWLRDRFRSNYPNLYQNLTRFSPPNLISYYL